MPQLSMQQRLKRRELSVETALKRLVDADQTLHLAQLDSDLNTLFFRWLRDLPNMPPIVPLLLWQNCYYVGSPVAVEASVLQLMRDRLDAQVQIVEISPSSYRNWFRLKNLDMSRIAIGDQANPLTGELEQEDITQTTELYLAQTDNQIERLKAIIASALRNRASDIHLEPTPEGLKVRYRIDGIMRHITTLPAEISRKVIVSLKVMCEMDIADSRRPQDGRISERYVSADEEEAGLDLRVSTLPCVSGIKGEAGEKAVLRLLRQQNTFKTIDDLGFSPTILPMFKKWMEQPQGMVILTGPTGSGKTSTLYTSLQEIATDEVNIITVEDPVEYVLQGITQTQVHELAGMTFAAGLRSILRQDPDIVMLGEIRDHETAETAVRAALTGHLVLTTLHTNDAVGVIPRLKDIGPDPGLISDALLGVVAQRLLRRVCPHCSEVHIPTAVELDLLGITEVQAKQGKWRKGKGCNRCFGTGYLGREAVMEVLNIDDDMRQAIYEGTIMQVRQSAHVDNFFSFRDAAIEKVLLGLTTVEEVKRVLPYSALCHRPVSATKKLAIAV
ncbi:type II/IV secretion system protein [filamentous cyanobacterium LEGE 11480]|uniref:Type II/IV secretion system protein n=1 Tax=Romeriopsis navalis LEGE 11480 TaxID=2777977 RepID=A0A928VLQ4_9CYAN|nr:GspE/PulE family protein [Romeriopsis navalis]MBE9028319.1 type II/IV secretion system protein [Romeriopsis navalis LEGE 11480]